MSHGRRLLEVAALFTRLGFTAFGGPAAHVAMMEDEVVGRRRWLDRRQFLDALAAINFIPGPNSTELAIHLGQVRAGFSGMMTAGVCFIVPAMLIILPIAWAYVRYGEFASVRGMMLGVNAAVVAIVVSACLRFARTSLHDRWTRSIAVGAIAADVLLMLARTHAQWVQPDLCVLALAALAGIARQFPARPVPMAVMMPLVGVGGALPSDHGALRGLTELAWVFVRIGATLFGSGYVLVSYLQTSVVDQHHWLDAGQLSAAVSVGQFTPGPLLTTATFIGYLRGWQIFHTVGGAAIGALVATASIFAPAFVLIALLGPYFTKLRTNPWSRAALDSVNAAVVSLIAVAAVRLGASALIVPGWRVALVLAVFVVSLIALLRYNLNATWMILLGAAVGLMFAG